LWLQRLYGLPAVKFVHLKGFHLELHTDYPVWRAFIDVLDSYYNKNLAIR
jgi:hypothetical protein